MSRYDPHLPHLSKMTGHALQRGGWPYVIEDGKWVESSDFDGHARCECGEWSPRLPSDRQRKKWHKAHKDALYAEGHR